MRIIASIAAVAVAATAINGTALAHHGWDAYDAAKQQKVTGTISELKWEQPHAVLFVTVAGKKQEVWLSPLQRMVDRGLQKEALKVGKTVTVKNIGVGACTVTPSSGNIDAATTVVLPQYSAVNAVWNGTQWYIF